MEIKDWPDVKQAIDRYGFASFWQNFIQNYLHQKRPDLTAKATQNFHIDLSHPIFDLDNLGELYEMTLEYDSRIKKKELGKYYTPKDAAEFMSKKLLSLIDPTKAYNIADVCCGTGNLITQVLSMLPQSQVSAIIKAGRLYLYDLDPIAIQLAIMKIAIVFIAKDDVSTYQSLTSHVRITNANFLSGSVSLPPNTIVISNPPYGKHPKNLPLWPSCTTAATGNLYSVFLEKIAQQAEAAVVITPQSFLGGEKFSSLRKALSHYGGAVYNFDNVPCPIFNGRKKGIFNTNTANSVRAAITIIDKTQSGFNVSPMIRFKSTERTLLFNELDNLLGDIKYHGSQPWAKIPKTLEPIVLAIKQARRTVNDLIEPDPTHQNPRFRITIPSTPRYFITGSHRNLSRSSKLVIYAKDQAAFDQLYLTINSTISYLWWRIYDGGITLNKSTLLSIPIPDFPPQSFKALVNEGLELENSSITVKLNAGKNNENIKFPHSYRRKLNHLILSSLELSHLEDNLYSIHSNNLESVLPLWQNPA